jgi:hypothetical protein
MEVYRMKKTIVLLAAAATLWMVPSWANAETGPTAEIMALERKAMDGWAEGNPDPQMAITGAGITCFHAVVENRLDGVAAVKALYEPFRGMPLFDSYEMRNPKVQELGEVAVLTYQLVRHVGSAVTIWNGTQVYQKQKEGWRVVHTHWSEAKAQ